MQPAPGVTETFLAGNGAHRGPGNIRRYLEVADYCHLCEPQLHGYVGVFSVANPGLRAGHFPSLLEPKFGQILPLVMLIVFLFNIVEASRRPATGFEAEAIGSGGLLTRLTEQIPRTDHQTTTISEESEASNIQLSERTDNISLEAGVRNDTDWGTSFHLAAIVYRDTPRWVIKLAFAATLAMRAGFICLLVKYYEQTVIALCALNLLYQLGHTCKGLRSSWRFWRA
ncbi:hypothetical protein LZ31DRAFT_591717 [Colletotrichum somersetense]|nr:hypothetical protein LZ31DRAFT_591717 [Colletotrichum somersetense]